MKKTIQCTHCGVLLPRDSEFCTACGEKVEKPQKQPIPAKRWKIAAIIFSIFMSIAMISTGLLAAYVFDLQDQLKTETAEKITYQNRYNSALKRANAASAEQSNYQSKYYYAYLELSFYERNIAFVVDGSDYYHTRDCIYYKNADSYWAYNVEAAKSRGYKQCPYCH